MRRAVLVLLMALVPAACGGGDERSSASTVAPSTDDGAVRGRLDEIAVQVERWSTSDDMVEVRAAAEAAANLVVGPNGPDYGDRDGDGSIAGSSDAGLLPGVDGTPAGVASSLAGNECVARDVLAGTIDDPATAWAEMETAIDAWTPSGNTMPTLASHPMRIVGWATFTLASDSLDEAHEYAGHAGLHVDVSLRAIDCSG